MHPHIKTLSALCDKPSRIIVGLMSGTSLDGLDIAVCKISGAGINTQCELLHFITIEYCDEYRSKVRQIFAKEHGSIQHLCLLNAWIGRYHAKLVKQALSSFGMSKRDVDAIASHGQTVYHCPKEQHGLADFDNATLQIGDGDHIAVQTGIMTLSDFRQKHIAAGGQGAPLVMYGDYLLFTHEQENRIMLNIGGIANLSFLPKNAALSDIFSSDIGPGNTMMDAFVQRHYSHLEYDKNAEIARSGSVDLALLNALENNAFFAQDFPKTTGPEVFNLDYLSHALSTVSKATHNSKQQSIAPQDILRTLCEFSANCIADAILKLSEHLHDVMVYVSGGGIHNPLLMERLENKLSESLPDASMGSTELLSLNPDAKEAVLFALLANETLCAKGDAHSEQTNMPSVSLGKISFPD
ncbi:anhydro-N-acetylmuramic acid kinase [Glaciecola siphonariae]|uniref:Anhydro-N-acetylmuramic acid kinase n=1 Tax=Glaciecola siphonariae TaxID=521012 RepID=A0ABV9M0D2_9ALTE